MPFTIFGPGVQDSMSSRQLFPNRTVEKTEPVAPYPRIHGSEEEDGRDPSDEAPPGDHHHGAAPGAGQRAAAAYAEVESPREPEQVHSAVDIMTAPVVSLQRSAPLEAAARLFSSHSFRHVPILDEQNKLVGILSERDLLRHAASRRLDGTTRVDALMADRVISATPGTAIREIARVMHEHHIGALPVVNEDGLVRGIVTRGDLLHTLIHRAPLELWA